MRMLILASLVTLTACETAPGPGSVPVAARLDASGLFVTLANGEVCEGISPVGRGVMEWSHELDGCSLSLAYSANLFATRAARESYGAPLGLGPLRYDPVPGAMDAVVRVFGEAADFWIFVPS